MGRAMKDSGVEWIGEIPEEWSVSPIKRNFHIFAGATPKTEVSEYWDGDIIWITPADYKTDDKYVCSGRKNLSQAGYNSCGTTMIPTGSLIFSKRAPVGTVAINTKDLCTNQGCLSCVPKNSANAIFYYYVMSVATEQFELVSSGATFKEISADSFANFVLPEAPALTQNIIAEYLDSQCAQINAIIEKTRASIEEYKHLKQAVITQAVTKGVRGDRPMKDSGIEWLCQIPCEWQILQLGGVTLSMRNGYVGPTRDLFVENGIRYIQSLHVKDGKIDFLKQPYFVMESWADQRPKIHTGDILIVQTGDIGQVALVSDEYDNCNCHALIIATPDRTIINPLYLTYYLMSSVGKELLLMNRTGALLPHLNSGKIKNTPVCLPMLCEQTEIAAYLDAKCAEIDALIAQKEQLLTELENYKKSLIYEYVTGKKEVPLEHS